MHSTKTIAPWRDIQYLCYSFRLIGDAHFLLLIMKQSGAICNKLQRYHTRIQSFMQEHVPVCFWTVFARTYMQCGQDEWYCISHLESPGWRRKTWPWVHAMPRANSEFFLNLFTVCLECAAPSPASSTTQQHVEHWCTWPQDVARLPALENFRHKVTLLAWLISKSGAAPLLRCVCVCLCVCMRACMCV